LFFFSDLSQDEDSEDDEGEESAVVAAGKKKVFTGLNTRLFLDLFARICPFVTF